MSNLTEPEKKILDAAKKVFEKYGYGGARMQHIADEAGISKASLHYYFRSKEKLFDLIFEESMAEFMPLISTWDEEDENWEEKLRTFISNFFKLLRKKSFLFILSEINRDSSLLLERKDMKSRKNKFLHYFEKLQDSGKIKDLDIRFVYMAMHSLCSFPILNSTLFKINIKLNDKEFELLMDTYPKFVADFLIEGIKKKKHK